MLRNFTQEYKGQAVGLVLDSDRSIVDVAKSIGVHEMTLAKWVKKARESARVPDSDLSESGTPSGPSWNCSVRRTRCPYDGRGSHVGGARRDRPTSEALVEPGAVCLENRTPLSGAVRCDELDINVVVAKDLQRPSRRVVAHRSDVAWRGMGFCRPRH
jgi:Transposase